MTAGAVPSSCSARAHFAAAAAVVVVMVVAVAAGLPGAAAQDPEVVTGLTRGRGFRVEGAPQERIIGGREVTLSDAQYGGGLYVLGRRIVGGGEMRRGRTGQVGARGEGGARRTAECVGRVG